MKNEAVGGKRFHINGFARGLVLTEAKGNPEMADCTPQATHFEE